MGTEGNFAYQEKTKAVRTNVNRVIVGKEKVVDLLLTAVLANGHVLLEDVPGTGKTMLAKTFARSVQGEFQRIQFTPDLLPSDVTGLNYYNQKTGEFVFRRGPVFGNVILADEINRATPRTQSSLLECMEERQVTVDGETRQLAAPFLVIATQNPVETAGTFPLPEAQLDRFALKLSMGYPTAEEELTMINRFMGENPLEQVEPVCSTQDMEAMQQEVKQVYVHSELRNYIVGLVNATRHQSNVSMGVSPRGTLTMMNVARAYAYVQGRSFVVPEDIQTLAEPVFAHRLILSGGMNSSDGAKSVVRGILSQVEVPTEEWEK